LKMAEEFLRPGEYVVLRGKGKVKTPYVWSGEVVLTNFRLIFLSHDYSFYIPLEEIEEVWTEGSFLSKTLHVRSIKKHYVVKVSRPARWEKRIKVCSERMKRTVRYLLGVPV